MDIESQAQQNAAYVFAQAVAAMADIEAMKAANHERRQQGYADAYGEDAFHGLIEEYQLGHNAVITNLRNGVY